MISKKYKCIFVHIPKTGGTSVENILKDRIEPSLTGDRSQEISCHWNIAKYKKKNNTAFEDYFKFTVVRNPWARLLSGYTYFRNGAAGSPRDLRAKEMYGDCFKKFIHNLDKYPRAHFLIPQYWYVNIKGIDQMDFTCRLENIKEDFKIIADKLKLEIRDLYKTRQTKHKHYTECYDEEMIDIVSKKYGKDIKYFGYKFGE